MKILYIYQFLTYGGIEMMLRNRAKMLKDIDSNIEVNLIVLRSSVSNIPTEFDNVYIETNKTVITKLVQDHDVIVNVDTPQLFNVLEKSSKQFILETYSSALASRKYIREKLPSNMGMVLVPSLTYKDIIEKEISNKDIPVKVVYNFIKKEEPSGNFNLELGKNRPILWIGRLEESKGWRNALEIFSKLKKINNTESIELFIVGELLDKYDKSIYEIMRDYGVLGSVRYLPRVDFKDMSCIYTKVARNNGIYLSTSKMETFGLTVLEAMSYGIPCVVNSLEIFEELYGNSAYLYKNESDASEYINKILLDNGLYSKLSEEVLKNAENFSSEKIISQLYNLYKEIL